MDLSEPKTDETETVEEKTESETVSSDEYEAIVLVPLEPEQNVISEKSDENFENVIEESIEEILVEEEKSSEEKVVENDEKSEEIVDVVSTTENVSSFEKYKVENLKDLESGSYYIQIAVLKDEANIQKIINNYGKNYPITIVPLASKSAYQILIGPVSVDEYATVLTRFKSYGFKDAFLRKVK